MNTVTGYLKNFYYQRFIKAVHYRNIYKQNG